MAELEAHAAVAVAIQIWRIPSGTVSKTVAGGLVGIGSWSIQDSIHSWGLAGMGSWRIRDCLSSSRCRMSLERCFPELACVHIHEHDNVADDDGGDQNRMTLHYLAIGTNTLS